MSSRDTIRPICAAFPGAVLEHSFGPDHDVWKVGGKMFAMVGAQNVGVTLKCTDAETAAFLIDLNIARPAPYLKRGGWVLLPWGAIEQDDLEMRLRLSYQTVRSNLTKTVQATLDPL